MDIKDENYLEDSIKKEVLKQGDKLSKKQKEELMQEAKVTVDFLNKVDEVELPSDNYVIFTDGKEQLYYENGEFYVISSTDGLKKKVKKTKKQATDMYLDYFIKYQLNPLLDARGQGKEVEKMELQKSIQKELAKEMAKAKEAQENAERVMAEEQEPTLENETQEVETPAVEEQEVEGQDRSL